MTQTAGLREIEIEVKKEKALDDSEWLYRVEVTPMKWCGASETYPDGIGWVPEGSRMIFECAGEDHAHTLMAELRKCYDMYPRNVI